MNANRDFMFQFLKGDMLDYMATITLDLNEKKWH